MRMRGQEGGEGVAVVWPVVLSLAQSVHQDDQHGGGGRGRRGQWLKDGLGKVQYVDYCKDYKVSFVINI